MKRRHFLHASAFATLASAIRATAASGRPPRILLRSSWQVVNIGDIAHTPGVLTLLERYIPEAEVRLWASGDLTEEVAAMEKARFPKLKIMKGRIKEDGTASSPELQEAMEWTDFLLHGSGPSFVARKDVAAFVKATGKPFGIYGITYSGAEPEFQDLMSKAQFVFFRDTVSMGKAKEDGISSPIMEFGPDGAFACDLRDDAKAEAFMAANGLEEGKFVCCQSRLRYTPYWTIPEKNREKDPERHARNEAMKEHDHRALRETIVAIVRETPMKVLLCPEDMTQMAVGKEMFWDKLPADVRDRVVWRNEFWLTDEALSTYVKSAGVFGSEMHSPIMALGNGVPAIVCRFEEQTSKGYMWQDIGLGDWLFHLDREEDHSGIKPAVLKMITDREDALARVKSAQAVVEDRQKKTMGVVRNSLAKEETGESQGFANR